jgi:pyruvate formate lyase activating enzyme
MSSREKCRLREQGFQQGSCRILYQGKKKRACRVTLKWEGSRPHRLIEAAHLSRPEHYFSIYQSGCNLSCKKCHSSRFTQHATGEWMSPDDIAALCRDYAFRVTYREPRERATSYHALDLCRSCGACVQIARLPAGEAGDFQERYYLTASGQRGTFCPNRLDPKQIVFSPQGFGPARNIIAFTGGDLMCQPDFYCFCAEAIKALDLELWVLLETNGYGLTPQNLDRFKNAGIDAFWLDIKAYNRGVHRRLTGVDNKWILKLPEEILKRGFVLEVLSLFIPGWVETDQIAEIAALLAAVDCKTPFTLLAFFPEYQMKDVPSPSLDQMLSAYEEARAAGLEQVRMANLGVFARTKRDFERLEAAAPGGW